MSVPAEEHSTLQRGRDSTLGVEHVQQLGENTAAVDNVVGEVLDVGLDDIALG